MKPYYSEFVRHCLRYYIKTQDEGHGGHPVFSSEADKANWVACYQALKYYTKDQLEIIYEIYRPGDTIADKIYQLSQTKGVQQDTMWNLIRDVERKIAKRRGLI